MTSKEYLSDGWGVGRRMVFCLESEHQKWLKNSEGSSYTNVLFLLPLFPRWFFFFFWGGKGCNFMDFSNLSCFMLWIWPWWGNYPDDQLIGGWTSKLSTCYCVVPENWSQGLVCPHTHTRIWRGRKTWIQKSTEYYTTNGDVVIHSSGFHLGVIFVP